MGAAPVVAPYARTRMFDAVHHPEPAMSVSRRRFVQLLGAGSAASLVAPTIVARGLEARMAEPRAPDGPKNGAIRLDSNENPNGADRAALDAIVAALGVANRYPDDAAMELRKAIAAAQHVDVANVALGCGSTDILRACVQAYTSPTRHLVTAAPTYESPGREAKILGHPVREVAVGGDLRLDLDAMAEAARGAGLVYVCNPNNPTATVHGKAAIDGFVDRVLGHTPDCTILLDEAYHEYVDDPTYATAIPAALGNPRVIVARTFSKVHGLAGVRVGYAVAHREAIAVVDPRTLDIGINVLGAVAARASLGVAGRIARETSLNRAARDYTLRFFTGAGYVPTPSQANFVMVDIKRDAKGFRQACRERGVLIGRAFPPLTTHARVSIGTMDEMQRATAVFRELLTTG